MDQMKKKGKDSYGDHISKILQRLGLPMNKLLHIGRNIGAKILELLEEEDEAIRKMGQWNPSVFDNSYSAKLPIGPMQKLAGYQGKSQTILQYANSSGVSRYTTTEHSSRMGLQFTCRIEQR
jgi:Centromere DNA-binding protein complex CBF3 subunit, domain 2